VNIQKYVVKKYNQIVLLVSKLIYATFKQNGYKRLKVLIRIFHSLY
jgi:hypothetical protein